MKITVVAVGKLKERFWADACAEYAGHGGPGGILRDVSPALGGVHENHRGRRR